MQHSSVLRVETKTWHRDSHDLFDYETPHVNLKQFFLSRAVKLFRTGADICCIADGDNFPQEADYLLSIKNHKDGKFLVAPAERSHGRQLNPKKLWMIVKDMPQNQYVLQENDVIKLGRFKLRVKQLVKNGEAIPELKLDDVEFPVRVSTTQDMCAVQCRICLFEGDQPDDPLVCPCQCRGSIQYVHVRCIGKWISNRLNISEDSKSSFFFKQIQCELCKAAFPSAIILNDERIQIVKVPNTTPPFIVLENINSSRGVHVISMAEKKDLKLGRGHESDVRIPDVSISRYHATIRFINDAFYLEDHNSKFGTLVALRKAHVIDHSGTVAVQVGRSVVNFQIDKNAKPTAEIIDASADLFTIHETEGRNTINNDNSIVSHGTSMMESAGSGASAYAGGNAAIENLSVSSSTLDYYLTSLLVSGFQKREEGKSEEGGCLTDHDNNNEKVFLRCNSAFFPAANVQNNCVNLIESPVAAQKTAGISENREFSSVPSHRLVPSFPVVCNNQNKASNFNRDRIANNSERIPRHRRNNINSELMRYLISPVAAPPSSSTLNNNKCELCKESSRMKTPASEVAGNSTSSVRHSFLFNLDRNSTIASMNNAFMSAISKNPINSIFLSTVSVKAEQESARCDSSLSFLAAYAVNNNNSSKPFFKEK